MNILKATIALYAGLLLLIATAAVLWTGQTVKQERQTRLLTTECVSLSELFKHLNNGQWAIELSTQDYQVFNRTVLVATQYGVRPMKQTEYWTRFGVGWCNTNEGVTA